MNGGPFLLVFVDFPSNIAVINLKLPLQLLALSLLVKVAVLVPPLLSSEHDIADHHAAEMGDVRNS